MTGYTSEAFKHSTLTVIDPPADEINPAIGISSNQINMISKPLQPFIKYRADGEAPNIVMRIDGSNLPKAIQQYLMNKRPSFSPEKA